MLTKQQAQEIRASLKWLGPADGMPQEIGDLAFFPYHPHKTAGDGVVVTKEVDESRTCWSVVVGGDLVDRSYDTLDAAILGALACKYDGLNSQAARLIARMLGIPEAPGH